MKLRDYQQKAVDSVLAAWKDHRSCVVVLPTGCGKTVVFAEVIRRRLAAEVKVEGEGEQRCAMILELLKGSSIPNARAKMQISRPTMRTIIRFLKARFELSYQALRAYRAFRFTLRF